MMNLIYHKTKKLLSSKICSASAVAIALLSKTIQLIYLFNIRADRSHQMIATYNLANNHGITKTFTTAENLSSIIYEPLSNWPPGYSLLLWPFYTIFNHNYIIGGIVVDILCAIIFILSTRSILKTLAIPIYLINCHTLLIAFIIYPFYLKPSSDAIAISFFLLALSNCLKLLLPLTTKWIPLTLGITISLSTCAAMKFMYIPIVILIPLFLIIKGWLDKSKLVIRSGVVSFILLSITILSLLLYQKNISGSVVHVAETTSGLFKENLLASYPFIPTTFVSPETIGQIFNQPFETGSFIYTTYQYIHFIVGVILLGICIWVIYKKGFRNKSITWCFFFLSLLVSLSILFLLSALSISTEKELGIWTYVQEARYYGLVIVLLQLAVFILYYRYKKQNIKNLTYLLLLPAIFFLPEVSRGILFDAKRIANFKKEELSWEPDYKFQLFTANLIKKEQVEKNIQRVVFTGSSPYMNNRIALYNHLPELKEINSINSLSLLNTKSSVLLLIVIREDVLKDFTPFISQPNKKEAGVFMGYHFFTTYVTPH